MKNKILSLVALLLLGCSVGMAADKNKTSKVNKSSKANKEAVMDEATRKEFEAFKLEKENARVWGSGKYLRLYYGEAQTATKVSGIRDSELALGIAKGKSFLVPTRAIGHWLKFGLDFDFVSLDYAAYPTANASGTSGWLWNGIPDPADQTSIIPQFRPSTVSIGVLGVGPTVAIAPFGGTSASFLQPLRLQVYGHYTPSVTAYIAKDKNSSMEASWAYTGMWSWGGCLAYKALGVGIEAKWGEGQFKRLTMEDDARANLGVNMGFTGKELRKMASTRVFLQLRF